MMRARIPVEAGNVGLSEGTLPAALQEVNASVELLPVMNQEDLKAGMAKLGRFESCRAHSLLAK